MACSSIFIFIIISFPSFYYNGFIEFWAVTWAMSLKKWLKSQGCSHNTEKNTPWMLVGLIMRALRASWTLSEPYHSSVRRSSGQKA